MILLFEEYHYPKQLLKDVLGSYNYMATELKKDKAKVQYVGYFFSKEQDDSVFILPKVFIKEEGSSNKAFGRYQPEDIIYVDNLKKVDSKDKIESGTISQSDYSLIYEHSVWIYRAISQFVKRNSGTGIVDDMLVQNPVDANGERSQTFIDIILQLIDFHKNHHHLFTYIAIINSSGNNKIHWPKTISKTQPIVKDNTPYYIDFKNKNKVLNFDEELIVLFYSALKYISVKYNFKIKSDVQYNLLNTRKIEDLIETKRGTRLLKKIRRKYYSDELVKLWKLLYIFFDMAENIKSHKYHEDKLLVREFNRVFEDMVDFLISDDRKNLPSELYNQQDGKLVDHIYKGTSLLDDNNDIYYIGDSKYYKDTTNYSKNSIYKQFTYAKNVIQYNINVFNNKENVGKIRYRDPLTEGYDITPNFFIRGEVDFEKLNNKDSNIEKVTLEFTNKHFLNRLFDRDTLFIQSYSINFLYLLNIYSTNVESSVRTSLRNRIREDFISFLESKFDFYLLEPLYDIHDAIEKNFRRLNGKMYKPSSSGNLLVMALEKKYVLDNLILLSEIESDFKVHEYHLDEQEYKTINSFSYWSPTFNSVAEEEVPYGNNKSSSAKYEIIDSNSVLLGVYKNEDHKNWILEKKKYNVRLGNRVGAVKQNRQVLFAKYLVLYNINDETEFEIYELGDNHNIMTGEQMNSEGYPFEEDFKDKEYYVYTLLEKTTDIEIKDLPEFLKKKRQEFYCSTSENLALGAPIYVYKTELLA